MIRSFLRKVEHWAFEDESFLLMLFKTTIVFGIAFSIVAFPIIIYLDTQDETEYNKCLNSGRGWAITGSHIQHSFITSGKVMIPTTTTVTEYGCVEVKR